MGIIGDHDKNSLAEVSRKEILRSWTCGHMSVFPTTKEAEAGESLEARSLRPTEVTQQDPSERKEIPEGCGD